MKQLLLLFATVFSFVTTQAQTDAGAATLQKIQSLPVFSLIKAPDSTVFKSSQLQSNRPTVIMFFNPDCDHCQKETKELLAWKEELKPLQIVMLSPMPFAAIKAFYLDYNIASLTNVVMGQDAAYKLGSLYRPTQYPAIFVYDASGKLAKAFLGNVAITNIINAVK